MYFSVVSIIISLIDVSIGGRRIRTKSLGNYDCVSINEEILDEWSPCSKTCGEGTKTKLNCEEGKNCETLCNLKLCPCKLMEFFHDNVEKNISSCTIKFNSILKMRHTWQNFTKIHHFHKTICYTVA